MTFINPKTDYAFKKIFGSSDNKGILISFLNAMIYDGNPTIEDLEIINPNLPPKITGLKDTYLDVKARLADGTLVIIEMQVLNVEFFGKRVLYNAAKTYVSQLQKGQGYGMLQPVIALTLTDFEMFENSDRVISRFVYKEETTNLRYTDNNMKLVFVELPKFTKDLSQLETLVDKWIYFIKYANTLTQIPETMDVIPEIHQAFDIANQVNLNPDELDAIERQEMFIYDQQGVIIYAEKQARKEAKKEATLAIARQLLDRLDDATIAQITGLSVQDVQNLRSEV
ncbi:MAG: Rpn family recombination-promoting nuclease/putative transposase [Microcoleus sp. PH2017_29_MFU_D_A]|jgi:predicted transposase/invertase (TIGR01784 family)|uniref:Rpn family recombination-promoting nuclease/putative transposase n=1 Tax=unclassified Microcoleus TaxID=2642155 RepID=UPI001DE0D049|nr:MULTISPECIES: Rpn family recombination-promoting nuclease/putative transposase [unclassified Microcoleus]MCC3433820.1 Rpn family recombination-promoting nuclease/putative transposase [Microcoleus sp. PH2017_04_SCI_O_A]MCC3444944.1 Rpn family recombination-promoting nuclease/putative transposase [Microcoleus sp. PH2017_03_ELD_O_A]TAE11669.1 MAG: Rpn family recombination-promoting nuclease/putative transposase [Oscillatoriales cyanobacterium]MCC3415676.1 Rpn family recombination-promoting nucl